MISINATLLLQIIHFLILIFILNRLMFRPILRIVSERNGHIEKTKADIENIELETEQLKEKFVSITITTRKEAGEERSQIRNSGLVEAEKFLNASRKKVSSIRAQADEEADKEFNKVRPLVRGEAVVLAEEIVENVIGRRIAVDP